MNISSIIHAMQDINRFSQLSSEKKNYALTAIVARLYSLKGMGDKTIVFKDGKPVKDEKGEFVRSENLIFAITELEKEIAINYPFLTMSEIQIALEAGVKNELDDDPTFLTVVNFCRWLALYFHSGARLEAAQAINSLKRITPSNQIEAGSIESRNDVVLHNLVQLFQEEVKTNGCIAAEHSDRICSLVYDWLRTQGMERPPQSEIDAAKAVAQKKVTKKSTILEDKVNQRAKRILLENYLREDLPKG